MKLYKYCPMCKSPLKQGAIDGENRRFCEKCGWINYLNPVPVVACLVSSSKGELLLMRRGVAPCKGKWALPGGFIELTETAELAGKRELFEETGLRGKPARLIGVYTQPSSIYGFVLVIGIELIINKETITPGDDAIEAKFFSRNKLPNVSFKSHNNLIRDYSL
ncbi:MAG: NUDIX hydrolase [Candidatus Omnitrophota bacterium]